MPFPTKLSTLSSIAGTEVDEYRQLYEMTTLDVVRRIKEAYAELYLIHSEILAIDESVGFLNQLFRIASQHYALGHAPQTDVLRAQIELAKMENERLTALDKREVVAAQVNTLLDRNTDTQVGIPQPVDTHIVTLQIDELYERARKSHPQLIAMQHMVERGEFMRSFVRQHYLPDLMFKFTQVEHDGAFTDQKYMFGLTVPLWFLGKQNNMVSEATANVEMLRAHYQHMENSVLLDVKAAVVAVDRSARTRVLYEHSIIPQAHANVKSALTAYEADEIDFITLLESERILLQFQLEYYRAQADFFKSVAELEHAVGEEVIFE
jgi:outer membrane protein TolC